MQILRTLGLAIVVGCFCFPACERTRPQNFADTFPILTPPAPATPRINGPSIFGVRPGSPFLYQIPATGLRPMEFSGENLPTTLTLDSASGLITGRIEKAGRTIVKLRATNALGRAEKDLEIVVGNEIALTPPMGWNSWNCFGVSVSQANVLAAARALVTTGLREHGWTFVNIDAGWQGERGGEFNALQPNPKFPDMPQLVHEIHALGLKAGIYSTPWRADFDLYRGSSADHADGSSDWTRDLPRNADFQFQLRAVHSWLSDWTWLRPLGRRAEEKARRKFVKQVRTFGAVSFAKEDAAQFAKWQFDYLKYDWIPIDSLHVREMRNALDACRRDIFLSVSNNARLELAPLLAQTTNAWRTTQDLEQNWTSVSAIGFSRDAWAGFNSPGHFNDADMMVVGKTRGIRPSQQQLSSDEDYAHFSLWCLLGGPLLISCDLEKLDAFTLGLLTNDEVLAIDQDRLCKQATCIRRDGARNVYAKELADGSRALGLFNRGEEPTTIRISWRALGLTRPQAVRDLWRQKDLGIFREEFETTVAPHGVSLIRVAPARF